jgi:hypothetical protein
VRHRIRAVRPGRGRSARRPAPGCGAGPHRGGPHEGARSGARRRARTSRRRRAAARAPLGPADARALPLRPAGGGARRLPARSSDARLGARDRAGARASRPRGSHPRARSDPRSRTASADAAAPKCESAPGAGPSGAGGDQRRRDRAAVLRRRLGPDGRAGGLGGDHRSSAQCRRRGDPCVAGPGADHGRRGPRVGGQHGEPVGVAYRPAGREAPRHQGRR